MIEPFQDNPPELKTEPATRALPYQPLPWLFFAAILGISFDRLLSPLGWYWIVLILVALLSGGLLQVRQKSRFASLSILLVWGSLFGYWHHVHVNRFMPNDLGFFAQTTAAPVVVEGTVQDLPRVFPAPPFDPGKVFEQTERTFFILKAERIRDGRHWVPVSGRVSVQVNGDRGDLSIGDRVAVFGMLAKPIGPQNPGDFDYSAQLRSQRILCTISVTLPTGIERLEKGGPGFMRWTEFLRRKARENLKQKTHPNTVPVAMAMLLGMREEVDDETTEILAATGTMHILAISGLHIGLIALALSALLWSCRVPNRISAVILILAVLFYLFLTDMKPPAIRATALVCMTGLSVIVGRHTLGRNTLCATALIVLALNPTQLFQFGAQLSFIATGAFFWVPSIRSFKTFFLKLFRIKHEVGSPASDVNELDVEHWWIVRVLQKTFDAGLTLFLVSLTIWAISLPLILQQVHLLTPIALLVNPLLWFPLTAALLSGFATMLLGGIPVLGELLGFVTDISFAALFGMITHCKNLGGHYWVPGPPGWWNFGFYSVFVFLTFLPVPKLRLRTLWGLILAWLVLGLTVGMAYDLERRWSQRLTFSVFSVGHGNCVLIITPEKKAIVYDVGCISSPQGCADKLSRGLWRNGKTKIDLLILSHSDSDHYNGVIHLLDRFTIDSVVVSPYMFDKQELPLRILQNQLNQRNIPIIELGQGDRLTGAGLKDAVFLHPPKANYSEKESPNASSLVLYFTHGKVRFLLPGDLDCKATPPFLLDPPLKADILMVPHHGGRSLQTEKLIEWTDAKQLIISAGRFTRQESKWEPYRNQGIQIRNTFQDGLIEISVTPSGTVQ